MRSYVLIFLFSVGLILSGCKDQSSVEPLADENSNPGTLLKYDVPNVVHDELQALKAATAKYNDINKAIADGYVDINVVIPQMGHHYLKAAFLNATFDLTRPEFLVYELRDNGHFKLVAVEYGVPLTLAAVPPSGFTGDLDVWVRNEDAGIWALHAWIWEFNPNGVFAPFNPNVP